MDIKKVICPSCGTGLKVTNSKNEAVKHISCPKCGTPIEVNFQDEPEEMTVIGDAKSASQAVLVMKGHSFDLPFGTNIVGRKSSSSDANIQLPVDDLYMSRLHATIKVTKVNGTLCVTISNYKNKNSTTVNGTELRDCDEVVLNHGDENVMGDTSLVMMMK